MTPQLDLHGVRHGEVSRKIDKFLGEHLLKGTTTINIITGHSTEMKRIVTTTLKDYNLSGESRFFNDGSLLIKLI